MLVVFQKWVKGHGQGHMFRIYGTFGKVLSYGWVDWLLNLTCHKEYTC